MTTRIHRFCSDLTPTSPIAEGGGGGGLPYKTMEMLVRNSEFTPNGDQFGCGMTTKRYQTTDKW